MINHLPRYIFNFLFLIALQVLVLNNIEFMGYVNPYLYIAALIILPIDTPKWALLIFGAALGLTIDVFMDTTGVQMAACVLTAYVRPYVLSAISPREGYEKGAFPTPSYYGFKWFFKYSMALVFIHHFSFFGLESFGIDGFWKIFLKTIYSSAFTMICLYIAMLLVYKDKKRV